MRRLSGIASRTKRMVIFKQQRRRTNSILKVIKFYVLCLYSQIYKFSNKIYVGYTLNIESRLETHNNGGSVYTKEHKPWELMFYCGFQDKLKAMNFEKYLKSHSGRIFLQKRLL